MSSSGIQKFLSQLLGFFYGTFACTRRLASLHLPSLQLGSDYLAALLEWLLILSYGVGFFFPVVAFVLQLRKELLQEVFFQNNISTFFMGCCLIKNSSTESARERLDKTHQEDTSIWFWSL